MQFRLTKKFATDLKILTLVDPESTTSPFDDWFIDVIRIDRKKIAIATHAKSTYTFFIPYTLAGGARGVLPAIGNLLKLLMSRYDAPDYIEDIELLFNSTPRLCKTKDRQILGYMNDFKRCSEYVLSIDKEGIYAAEQLIANIPIKVGSEYTYPIERLGALLGCSNKFVSTFRKLKSSSL